MFVSVRPKISSINKQGGGSVRATVNVTSVTSLRWFFTSTPRVWGGPRRDLPSDRLIRQEPEPWDRYTRYDGEKEDGLSRSAARLEERRSDQEVRAERRKERRLLLQVAHHTNRSVVTQQTDNQSAVRLWYQC